jgi:hypothetical protein
LHQKTVIGNISLVGFNKRKLEDQRREAADKEATNRRSTDALVALDAKGPAAWRCSARSAAPRHAGLFAVLRAIKL